MSTTNFHTFTISHRLPNDPYTHRLLADAKALGFTQLTALEYQDLYFVKGQLKDDEKQRLIQELLSDPIVQVGSWEQNAAATDQQTLEIALLPGVTDPVAEQIVRAAEVLGIPSVQQAATGQRFILKSANPLTTAELHTLARRLFSNPVIQHYAIGTLEDVFPPTVTSTTAVEVIPIRDLSADQLLALSRDRRAALDQAEMHAIQAYYRAIKRDPTDVEFETIAQTWSEHCSHKTFRAKIVVDSYPPSQPPPTRGGGAERSPNLSPQEAEAEGSPNLSPQEAGAEGSPNLSPQGINVIHGLLKTYIRAATEQINAPWVWSAFVDNAGIIDFDDQYQVSFKVETHNHPSAIEPFGGANTGVGGVLRDVLGVSAKPIATTDIFCFGPQDLEPSTLPEGTLHPHRIRSGVVAGVQDYGNKTGIPTVNGAIWYDAGYTANPIVYCGCVGLSPKNSHPRQPQAGDRVIVLGGRTGRDGLRGATFSSMTMDAQTGHVAGASVQIGDPIIAKGLIEVVTRARDQKLYHAITDCGAGGFSSAVGEMASTIGATVDIALAPLKYQGLAPWEIWLSEAQERMVMAVPPEKIPALREICATYAIELTDIGAFNNSQQLIVRYGENVVLDLQNEFLFDGMPVKTLQAQIPTKEQPNTPSAPINTDQFPALVRKLLAHPNIASKENVIRRYDHEVQGGTVIKPLTGAQNDGPSDACVLKPQGTQGLRGIVLANGLNPEFGKYDAHAMALSVVDEAIRNAVAVGADPSRIAILDNFCWGDPKRPETLGALVEATRGCYAAAIHYQTPFISGKDSLNNEYLGSDGQRHAIPGTLLISAIGIIPDVTTAVTMDLKKPGNVLYLLGETRTELVGSHFQLCGGQALGTVPSLPQNAPALYRSLHQAIQNKWVRACHDLSEGGLAVAIAEMCIGGRLGCNLTLDANIDPTVALFSESNGRLLVEVEPQNCAAFEACFSGKLTALVSQVGNVTADPILKIQHTAATLVALPVAELVQAWQSN